MCYVSYMLCVCHESCKVYVCVLHGRLRPLKVVTIALQGVPIALQGVTNRYNCSPGRSHAIALPSRHFWPLSWPLPSQGSLYVYAHILL
jgi:hypothetical protein